jgi:hypothetical protein
MASYLVFKALVLRVSAFVLERFGDQVVLHGFSKRLELEELVKEWLRVHARA